MIDLHRSQLEAVIDALEGRDGDGDDAATRQWLGESLRAFRSMLARGYNLSPKQVAWVEKIADRVNQAIPRAPVPRGREVALLFKPGPLKPPPRRQS